MMKTHEQFADDLALYALGELAGSDRQQLEEHLHTCAACRRELQALRGDLGLLGLSSSGAQPPARSKERLMRAIAAEPRPGPQPLQSSSRGAVCCGRGSRRSRPWRCCSSPSASGVATNTPTISLLSSPIATRTREYNSIA